MAIRLLIRFLCERIYQPIMILRDISFLNLFKPTAQKIKLSYNKRLAICHMIVRVEGLSVEVAHRQPPQRYV